MLSSNLSFIITIAVTTIPLLFCCAMVVLLIPHFFGIRVSEVWTYSVVRIALFINFLMGVVLIAALSLVGTGPIFIEDGAWFGYGETQFKILFQLDVPAVVYGVFSIGMVALVSAFSRRYLHREAGFHRFYALLMLFVLGLSLVSFAGSVDVLIVGWELVGVSSTLLIAFFNRRPKPIRNALRAFATYRSCDVGLLIAALSLHSIFGTTGFSEITNAIGNDAYDVHASSLSALAAFGLLLAAAGKSAQVPFSGWLPRAMEGPTPSSAIFYGALSVHLGPVLLLRTAALYPGSVWISGVTIILGLLTAIHGATVQSVKSDIKSRLAYGSITQTGLIFIEIGAGFHTIALIHCIGHAGYRTLQILRAPSLLHDRSHLEQMLGHHVSPEVAGKDHWYLVIPKIFYRHALERGGLDAILRHQVVGNVQRLMCSLERIENRISGLIADSLLMPSRWISGVVEVDKHDK